MALSIQMLDNAEEDLGHIEDVSTSTLPTATDRLGNEKMTVAGAVATIAAINPRGAWASGTEYAQKDVVSSGGSWYICVQAHTSAASFATDAGKWRIYQGTVPSEVPYTVATYSALRSYAGDAYAVYVSGYLVTAGPDGVAGLFTRDDSDTTSADNGGTIIVASDGTRWKRVFDGEVSILWFGADRVGVTDSAPAVNSAVALNKPVRAPAGEYRLASPITKNNTASGEGLVLLGDGIDKTVFLCDFSAPAMTGSTAQGVINLPAVATLDYLRGTRISGLTIKPKSGTAHTNTHGILANCQFFPIFKHVRVQGMPGSGFYSPLRADLSANSDDYQNTLMQFLSCEFDGNEYGWYGESGLGCAATTIKGGFIVNNRRSGVRGGGVLGVIENCAIGNNGASGSLAGVDTCGVIIDTMNGTTSRNWAVRNVEFESNYHANLWVRSCMGFESENLRLNAQGSTDGGATLTTPVQVLLGDTGTAVRSARFKGDVSKSDPGWAATLAMYKIRGADTATVEIVEPVGTASSDNTAGFSVLDTSTTTGALDGVHILRGGIWSQSRSWSKQPLAKVYPSADIAIPSGVDTTVICNTELLDNASAHNTATGIYTVPSVGIYRVTASFQVQSPVATSSIVLRIRRSGATIAQRRFIARGDAYETYTIDDVVNCATPGDTLSIQINQNTGSDLTLDGGFAAGGIMFEKVG